MKIIKILVLLPLLLFSFPFHVFAQKPPLKLVLGTPIIMTASPVLVAEAKGYFKEEGLDVIIKEFDSGKAALKGMLDEGDMDMVTVAETPIVLNSFKRQDFAIVASMATSNNNVKICARRDRGINQPSDLRGKKIGRTLGSNGHFFLDIFLMYNGVSASEVETVDLTPPELITALVDGSVDAISTWEPNVLFAGKRLGDNAVVLQGRDLYQASYYFVANRGFLVRAPEAVKKFLKAIIRATEFIQRNKDESVVIIAKRLKIERDLLELTWHDFVFDVRLEQSMFMTFEDEARWAVRNQMVTGSDMPNYLNMIYFDAMEALAPAQVTIIRKPSTR